MLVHPTTVWRVMYRNADGVIRCHTYFTKHHAEQFARAMKTSPHISEIEIRGENPFHFDHVEPTN